MFVVGDCLQRKHQDEVWRSRCLMAGVNPAGVMCVRAVNAATKVVIVDMLRQDGSKYVLILSWSLVEHWHNSSSTWGKLTERQVETWFGKDVEVAYTHIVYDEITETHEQTLLSTRYLAKVRGDLPVCAEIINERQALRAMLRGSKPWFDEPKWKEEDDQDRNSQPRCHG